MRFTGPANMQKMKNADTFMIGYDYFSLMHYGRWHCASKRQASMTFTSRFEGDPEDVGQRIYLSDKDIQHINAVYCSSEPKILESITNIHFSGMMMKLVGGRDNSEGRLEVNNEKVWGTVCSDGFDRNDANVVCKYLGRPGVEEVYSAADIPNIESAQDSPIWLSDLECTGQENNPFLCSNEVMKHHTNCDHNQDVAIRCSSKHISHTVASY